jgi:UDP-2-acetamido-2,6-beta-L-arabino-hexul-4-ose reductase
MKILITGANGFVGRNLVASLEAIRDGKNRTRNIKSLDILSENVQYYTYDINSTPEELDNYCSDSDFVFNLAGVNRPQNPAEFMSGNFGLCI